MPSPSPQCWKWGHSKVQEEGRALLFWPDQIIVALAFRSQFIFSMWMEIYPPKLFLKGKETPFNLVPGALKEGLVWDLVGSKSGIVCHCKIN